MIIYAMIIFLCIKNFKGINIFKKIILLSSATGLSIVYVLLYNPCGTTISAIIVCLIQSIVLRLIVYTSTSNTLVAVIISYLVSYILLAFSAIVEFSIQIAFNIDNIIANLMITVALEGGFVHFIINSRKLKNGLTFLKVQNEYIEITIINIATVIVILQGLMGNKNEQIYSHLYYYYMILVVFLIIFIEKTITMYYKQKLVDDTINQYKQELQEKDSEIKRLTDEAFKVSKINHEFYNRQKSLELMVKNALQNANMEIGEELNLMDRIKEITAEHTNKMESIKLLTNIQLTKIDEIDDMFKFMQTECSNSGINFNLNINGNIHPLVNNIIAKSKLVTLIGDHIRDAIIAINSSDRSNREIFVFFGLKGNCYELSIFDTGIEFEKDTLLNLGLIPVTTHKSTGGSGIGFITTFETLKECKASLIIEEKHEPSEIDYTKAVKIRFDGKSEFRISSYRLEDLFRNKPKCELLCEEVVVRKIGK